MNGRSMNTTEARKFAMDLMDYDRHCSDADIDRAAEMIINLCYELDHVRTRLQKYTGNDTYTPVPPKPFK